MLRLGFAELLVLLFVAALILLVAFIWWRIFSKTGHSGALGLLMLVPIVNLIMLLFLAFSEWPVQREVRMLRGRGGLGPPRQTG